jgi:putative ABC transport system permease protein
MRELSQDARFAARMLAKTPGFTAVLILTLALGIGANTAIFSVVYGVLLRPLPYPAPERLIWVWDIQPALANAPLSSAEFLAYREQGHSLEYLVAIRQLNFNMVGQGSPERLRGQIVTTGYFPMLGVQAAMGRSFTDADGQPGAARVALLTDGFWRRRFGGEPGVIGRNLTLNGESVSVVGILPAAYQAPPNVDLFLNPKFGVPEVFPNGKDPREQAGTHYLSVMGKLRRGATLNQAQAELGATVKHLFEGKPASDTHDVKVVPFTEYVSGEVRPTLLALLGAVGFVLLIACANVANLLVARATARQREMAVRAALGASAWRLARQMITEGVLLGVLGALAGLPLAYGGLRALVLSEPQGLPRLSEIHLDFRVLLFTFIIAVITGILFGLAPALRGARVAPGDALKQAGRSGGSSLRQNWLRSALVVSEVALSLMLLVGAGLLTRSFVRLLQVQSGFRPENMTVFSLSFTGPKYTGFARHTEVMSRFVQALHRIEALPGVEGIAGANDLPLEGQDTTSYPTIEGHSAVAPNERILVGMHAVTPGYLRAMGIPLLRGREFNDNDFFGTPSGIVINQALAKRVWPGEDPIGKHMRLFVGQDSPAEEVIGVVGNVKHNGLQAEESFDAYCAFAQHSWPYMSLSVRTTGSPEPVLASIRGIMAEFDPDLPVYGVRSMDKVLAESLGTRRLTLALTGGFALLALALAGIGVYGVMSYVVANRTREIGVRMALGAQAGDVLRLVLGQGMRLAALGIALGALGAFWLARLIVRLLYAVKPNDPLTFAGVALLLGIIALLACYIPARRATRVDPLAALRYE